MTEYSIKYTKKSFCKVLVHLDLFVFEVKFLRKKTRYKQISQPLDECFFR